MLTTKKLFQTLADYNNPSAVESHGPYKCKRSPWFGEGYYFWDSFVQLAHWWGKIGYGNSYIICQIIYPYNDEDFFDITGSNIEQLKDFHDFIIEYFGSLDAEYTIPQVIELMKFRTNLTENFIGIRGRGKHKIDIPENNIPIKYGKPYVYELFPPIQVCFFDNKVLKGYDFKVIHPDKYVCQDMDMTDTTI